MDPVSFTKTPIEKIIRLTKHQIPALHKLGLKTVGDVLYHFPVRYGDNFSASYIKDADSDTSVTLFGRLTKVETGVTFKTKIPNTSALLIDESGKVRLIWFNQVYIGKMFKDGDMVKVSGIVKGEPGKQTMTNPNIYSAKLKRLFTSPYIARVRASLLCLFTI